MYPRRIPFAVCGGMGSHCTITSSNFRFFRVTFDGSLLGTEKQHKCLDNIKKKHYLCFYRVLET